MDGIPHTPKPNHPPAEEPHEQHPKAPPSAPLGIPAMTAMSAMSGAAPAMLPPPSQLRAAPPQELPFVQPSSYLRPKTTTRSASIAASPMSPIDEEQMQGLVSPARTPFISQPL